MEDGVVTTTWKDHEHHFLDKLRGYLQQRGSDAEPPLFAKRPVNQFKLWLAVTEQGGYGEVTANKGWARIGRMFDPPKTMTDLSFRIKRIYEVSMLPFEKAVRSGQIDGVPMPEWDGISKETPLRPKKVTANIKKAAPMRRAGQLKRQRTAQDPSEDEQLGEAELVNKRIRVLWPGEGQFFSGTISGPGGSPGKWQIVYDDGDIDEVDLKKETWHMESSPSPKRDAENGGQETLNPTAGWARESPQEPSDTIGPLGLEAVIGFGGGAPGLPDGAVPMPTSLQTQPGSEAIGQHTGADSQAGIPRQEYPPSSEKQSGEGGPRGSDSLADIAAQRPSSGDQEDCILEGDGYKVYEATDSPSYEIFCLVPGLSLAEIRVQCWDSGKLLVTGEPKDPGESKHWGVTQIRRKLRLPTPVQADSARALVTMHGQLYIKVFRKQAAQ